MDRSYRDVEGFTKPTNLKQIKKEEVKGEEVEAADPEIEKYPMKLDYETYFGKKVIVDEMIESGKGSAIHPVRNLLLICYRDTSRK